LIMVRTRPLLAALGLASFPVVIYLGGCGNDAPAPGVVKLTNVTFDNIAYNSGKVVLVKFLAPW